MVGGHGTVPVGKKNWVGWAILFILPLIFYHHAVYSQWVSDSDVHGMLEFWAASTGLVAAVMVLLYFLTTGSKFFLMISLGFTLQGTEDLIHAIYSFSRIWPAERVGIENFVPGTYVTGRLILAFCLLVGLYLARKGAVIEEGKRLKEAIVYNIVGFALAAIVTVIIINSPLPKFILPESFVSRPVDFIAAVLYLITFFGFAFLYRKREFRTPFVWCIIASLILGCVTQIYMIHSQTLYDAQFDVSHIVKIISYIFPIFGVWLGTFDLYRKSKMQAMEIEVASREFMVNIQDQAARIRELEGKLGSR